MLCYLPASVRSNTKRRASDAVPAVVAAGLAAAASPVPGLGPTLAVRATVAAARRLWTAALALLAVLAALPPRAAREVACLRGALPWSAGLVAPVLAPVPDGLAQARVAAGHVFAGLAGFAPAVVAGARGHATMVTVLALATGAAPRAVLLLVAGHVAELLHQPGHLDVVPPDVVPQQGTTERPREVAGHLGHPVG